MDKDYLDMDSGWRRGAQSWTVDNPPTGESYETI